MEATLVARILVGQVRSLALLGWILSIGDAALAESTNNTEVGFWPPEGIYTNFVGVMLSTSAGRVQYTTDGGHPTPTSAGYWDPILVTGSNVIRAAAFKDGQRIGPVYSKMYQIVTNPESAFCSPLPIVVINTLGATLLGRERVSAWISVFGTGNGPASFTSPVSYSGRATTGIRGSSSKNMPKKPYRIELQDEQGHDLKAPLLGMPKESDWVLLASYTDRTFIRDPLAYELWRQMGHYAPRFRFVEVFMAETNRVNSLIEPIDYRGIYLLVEKPKRGKSRIAIEKLESTDTTEPAISGGYIFKKDRPTPGEIGLKTARLGLEFVLEEPKERNLSIVQRNWLQNYLDGFEEALFNTNTENRSYAS